MGRAQYARIPVKCVAELPKDRACAEVAYLRFLSPALIELPRKILCSGRQLSITLMESKIIFVLYVTANWLPATDYRVVVSLSVQSQAVN